MSNGFRIFLLTLVGFGAVWIYRFRAPELNLLLQPAGLPPRGADAAPGGEGDLARGRLQPPARVGLENLRSSDWDGMSTWSPNARAAAAPPPGSDPDLVLLAAEESEDGLTPIIFADAPRVQSDAGAVRQDGDAALVANPDLVEIVYTVREGDSVWKVAEEHLGRGDRYKEIVELNALPGDGEVLPVGTELRLRTLAPRRPEEMLKSRPPTNDNSVEEGSTIQRNSVPHRTHEVKRGETLGRISERYFPGDPAGVETLFEANRDRLSSPDRVREGQVLEIPSWTR